MNVTMNKNIFTLLSLGLMLVGCGQQTQKESGEAFTDNVQLALADSGRVDLNSLQWTREPGGFEIKGDRLSSRRHPTPTCGSAPTTISRTTMLRYCR